MRKVYISRFWVLRAIYEGLMLPVLLLFVSLLIKHFWERDKDADFEFMFSEAATHFTFKDELITKLIEENKKVAFSFLVIP